MSVSCIFFSLKANSDRLTIILVFSINFQRDAYALEYHIVRTTRNSAFPLIIRA
jgi:hypothetical protein